jgi:uncharacterized membrane protein
LIVIVLGYFVQINAKVFGSENEYSVKSLFIGIFSNGDALIQQDIKSNPIAKELSISLLGTNVTNLAVKNYSSHSLSYYVIVKTNELRINPQGSSEIRITYITPTIVDKQDRIWTFSINSTSKFTVKLPNDAVVTSLGDHQPNLIRRLGEQELLTFEPGKSTVNYILGYVGTREQAETALISARNDITAAQNTLGRINLTYANEFLEQARLALENGNFVDAERFASNSSYLVNKISSDFELAKETIRNANEKIRSFQQMNLDVNQAESLLSQSNIKFATGEYAEAANLASMALESLANKLENGNQFLVPILGVISSIALSGLFIMFYMKKLKSKKRYYDTIGVTPAESISHDNSHNIKKQQNTPYSKTKAETGLDLPISNLDHVTQTDKHLDIRRLVEAKLMEYPNLREEDQKVIYFLADKEGSAFEAEIRTKFVLPKTSLWRLVKRLERLELIEVTKMAGQNLLRLKL